MTDLCIDARMAFSSGIGTCIREIIPFFKESPFRVTLLVDKLGAPWCCEFKQILFDAPIYSIKEQALYPVKIPHCDLFWSPHYNVPLLPTRAKKQIVTIHDACHLALSKYLSKPERVYARFVMGRALHKSDQVVTDSHFSKSELCRHLGTPKNTIEVIPAAVNREQFQRVKEGEKLEAVRQKYHLPKKFFLYVGNLKAHKNLAGLLKAFEQISLSDYGLAIVGKSSGLRNHISPLVGSQIFTLGEIPHEDLISLYSLAELFVFPSFYEGFGLPPLEAMSCGCPTVVSMAASIPEVCGDASLYFQPDKPKEIAGAMIQAISDKGLKQRLIQKGFERVQVYNWAKTANQYLSLFEKMLSR